ncbi:MATE family efflux transporter [Treponema sp. OMZ 787]|uniref:MATE family efflux transporter n=1 Tax=Treponema sp. OMZ 787 TaxID=2563669 RepID=UPI0020A4F28D|nr:MATE family efflux transporter [Treponema sp. OMZ 787]UTC63294.1 MATE family efflux transporter [Treponema sp. OMZ 787]
MHKKNLDLTEGVIWKTLIIFTLPILAGNFFQHLYTAADAVIVGKFTGKEGLAAIDSVISLLKLPINFFSGLSAGAAIIISQLFGAKKTKDLFDALHTSIGLTLILGIGLSIIGVLISSLLLLVMGVPKDIFEMTLSYVRIYFAGMGVSLFYNIGSGILRAMGNSKTPFYALIVSSALNVILDLIFIGIFNWGIGGAALATVVSQLISALIILFALIKKTAYCPLELTTIKINRLASIKITRLGLPIGIQSAFFPIANMIIQAKVNGTGTVNIAAWALCGKLDFLIWILLEAMTSSLAAFVAQNYGAKKYDRITGVVRSGLIMSGILIGSICVVLYFWNVPLGKLFINAKDYEVLIISERLMQLLAPFYTIFVLTEIFSAVIHATGETFKPMLMILIGVCVTRILWVILFVPINPVIEMIVLAFPISWTLTSIIFTVYYFFYRKKIC